MNWRLLWLVALCLQWSAASGRMAFTSNITKTLDGILSASYDKRIRPDIGGAAVKVLLNLHIKSLGPISENDEVYVMDVYFRQAWLDRRLGFSLSETKELSMSWLFLEKIWVPDTFFLNGKKSHLHRMTSPNKFVRLRSDGYLMYSMRLTVSARCKMYLKKFPLDSQVCPLIIGSYGYRSDELSYEWDERGVSMEKGISEAQFDIVSVNVTNGLFTYRGQDKYSLVSAQFYFKRSIGYYVLQIYVPCSLIVSCSWISFWITPKDVAGRTTLAVTTVLSITTLGFGGRSQLPKVSHATALDCYVIICFAFAFAVMVEYAVINFTDKLAADIKKLIEERQAKAKASMTEEGEERMERGEKGRVGDAEAEEVNDEEETTSGKPYVFLPHRWFSVPNDLSKAPRGEMCWTPTATEEGLQEGWYARTAKASVRFWRGLHFLPRQLDPAAEAKFHQIDMVARRLFPVTFCLMVLGYCLLYTYYIADSSGEPGLHELYLGSSSHT